MEKSSAAKLTERGDERGEVGVDFDAGERVLTPGFRRVFAGANRDRTDAGIEAGLGVARAIADHGAVGGIEVVRRDHFLNETWRRFAVERRLVGRFGGDAKFGEERRGEGEQRLHAGVDEKDVVERVKAATDAGLIGEKKQFVAEFAGALERGADTGNQFHAGGVSEVVFVDDDRAVAVEKKGAGGILDF